MGTSSLPTEVRNIAPGFSIGLPFLACRLRAWCILHEALGDQNTNCISGPIRANPRPGWHFGILKGWMCAMGTLALLEGFQRQTLVDIIDWDDLSWL